MKKIIYTLCLVAIMVFTGCNNDDPEPVVDSDAQFETLREQLNTNITSLQSLVDAIYSNDIITSISPLIESDKEVGYIFSFAKSQPVSIYYGDNMASPSIGVKQDNDRIYYWTLNEDWLLNGNGKKIISYGASNTILPKLKIEDKTWYLSLDDGKSWLNLGQSNNVLFSDIDISDADNVVFTLSNGAKLIIPRQPEITITLNVDNNILVEPNATITIGYTIAGEIDSLSVKIITSGNIKAEIEDGESAKGWITVKTDETVGELDKVILIASNGSVSTSKSLTFEEKDFVHVSNATNYNVMTDGGSIELNLETNADYMISIPTEAQGWISVAQSRAIRQETITLTIAPNSDVARTAHVYLTNKSGVTLSRIQISQDGQLLNTEIPASMTRAFPDEAFRNYVLQNFDTNSDGTISEDEAFAVNKIEVRGESFDIIKSLEGIQYFQNLNYLDCSDNEIKTLNLSENKALTTLHCDRNQIVSLDIYNCTALNELKCSYNQISYLNLSKSSALATLDCSRNELTALDLSNCTALTHLSCSNALKSLDLSNCPNLKYLDCTGNDLTSLDLSDCAALTQLICSDNKLTSLNISNCVALSKLQCSDNRLASIDLSNCSALTEVACYDNRLSSLDLSNCRSIKVLHCSSNYLKSLDLSNCPALTNLTCSNNKLNSLNIANCTALTTLWCESNKLTSLKIAQCRDLTYLSCSENQIPTLDISQCPALTYVNCHYNVISKLDCTNCTDMYYLDCSYNLLTSLDITKNAKIIELHCYHNQLVELDLTNATGLSNLYCYDNKLTSLDLTHNPELTDLDCYGNQLTELDLSVNRSLAVLDCGSNLLTSLDLSNNLELTTLTCVMTSLETLYLRRIQKITGINSNRSLEFINPKTEIQYID